MTVLYGIIISIILILNLGLAAALFVLKAKPDMLKTAKVISVNSKESTVEVDINGETKIMRLSALHPVDTIVPVFYFNDGTDELVEGIKYIRNRLPYMCIAAVAICAFYLVGLFLGAISGFGSFMAIVMSSAMCVANGLMSVFEYTFSKDESVELEIEYDSYIELEDGEVHLFSPVFKYVENEETKYLKGFKYVNSEEIELYKNGPMKVRYNDSSKKFRSVKKLKSIKTFGAISIICIVLTAVAPLVI